MTKLKSPLLSLRASGPLANTLSFDNRQRTPRVRTKPIPPYSKTLPQIYQRWDYQDGILWWAALTAAEKQTWERNARAFHRTGFAHYMSWYLKNLPYLVARYTLDDISAGKVSDKSPSPSPGTVYGASLVDAVIANGLHFDGIDNYVHCTTAPKFDVVDYLTIECIINSQSTQANFAQVCDKAAFSLRATPDGEHLYGRFQTEAGVITTSIVAIPLTHGIPQRIVCTYHQTIGIRIYENGDLATQQLGDFGQLVPVDTPLLLGQNSLGVTKYRWKGILDHFVLWNNLLTPTHIQNHSLRHYP